MSPVEEEVPDRAYNGEKLLHTFFLYFPEVQILGTLNSLLEVLEEEVPHRHAGNKRIFFQMLKIPGALKALLKAPNV